MSLPALEIQKAYAYCEHVTKRHAKSFYFAAKFLPRRKQRAVYPIYAFCRHVDDEIDELGAGDEAEAVAAVERWRRKLNEVYRLAETPGGEAAKREAPESGVGRDQTPAAESQALVFLAWRDLLAKYQIPQNLPLELIRGVVQDVTVKRYETFEELYVYCYRVASTVGLMSSEVLGYGDEKALGYAEAMGVAMQLTNILRDVKEDAALGRIYLPLEDLRRFGVSEEQVSAGRFDENFAALVKFQVARARAYYVEGERGIALLEKDSRFTVLLAARIYAKILDEIEKQRYNVFAGRAHTSRRQKLFAIPRIWMSARRLSA